MINSVPWSTPATPFKDWVSIEPDSAELPPTLGFAYFFGHKLFVLTFEYIKSESRILKSSQ